jgi:hypothetical protein
VDPNETLQAIRRLSGVYRHAADWADTETDELVSHIENLDEWLSKGGFAPADWRSGGAN